MINQLQAVIMFHLFGVYPSRSPKMQKRFREWMYENIEWTAKHVVSFFALTNQEKKSPFLQLAIFSSPISPHFLVNNI